MIVARIRRDCGIFSSVTLARLILFCIFGFYFFENTLLSKSWAESSLYDVDSFHMSNTIRGYQYEIAHGLFDSLFESFNFAYGSLHWAIDSILLMPAYLTQNQQIQIIAGRELTLLFGFGCVWIMGQIASRFTQDFILKYAVMVNVSLLPVFGVWSTKLHVDLQYAFFGFLAFYLLISEENLSRRNLILSSFAIGACVAMKLTGALIAPLLALILIQRLVNFGGFKQLLKWFSIYVAISVPIAFFGMRFVLSDFFDVDKIFSSTVSTVQFFALSGTPPGPKPEILRPLLQAMAEQYFHPMSIIILLALGIRFCFAGETRANTSSETLLSSAKSSAASAELIGASLSPRFIARAIFLVSVLDLIFIAIYVRKT